MPLIDYTVPIQFDYKLRSTLQPVSLYLSSISISSSLSSSLHLFRLFIPSTLFSSFIPYQSMGEERVWTIESTHCSVPTLHYFLHYFGLAMFTVRSSLTSLIFSCLLLFTSIAFLCDQYVSAHHERHRTAYYHDLFCSRMKYWSLSRIFTSICTLWQPFFIFITLWIRLVDRFHPF